MNPDDLGTCAKPGCYGLFWWSNVHQDPATCNVNPKGTPTGCDEKEGHHPFVVSYEAMSRIRKE